MSIYKIIFVVIPIIFIRYSLEDDDELNKYAYLVSTYQKAVCHGYFIDTTRIVTRASCFYDLSYELDEDPSHYKVELQGDDNTDATITEIFIHPEFYYIKMLNDIAIVRVSITLDLDEKSFEISSDDFKKCEELKIVKFDDTAASVAPIKEKCPDKFTNYHISESLVCMAEEAATKGGILLCESKLIAIHTIYKPFYCGESSEKETYFTLIKEHEKFIEDPVGYFHETMQKYQKEDEDS